MGEHEKDERPETFTLKQLEQCETYDELWNATRREINLTSECHSYVRMLWGKLVIQWSKNYETAFKALDDFNNRLCLDGRNPNSYAGILWCFGKHDRAWKERPIFGKLRYMTSKSTGKKFDSAKYIEWTRSLEENPELPPVFKDADK